MPQDITQQLTKNIALRICPTSDQVDLSSFVWAINWLNYKSKFYYKIYTLLASPLALNIGAKLYYKGAWLERLHGDLNDSRELLLIVRYPSVYKFLQLMSNSLFKWVSLLRLKGVTDFVFGFTQPVFDNKNNACKASVGEVSLIIILKSFQSDTPVNLEQLIKTAGLKIIFFGKKVATLQRQTQHKKEYNIPFFIEQIVVISGTDKKGLIQFYENEIKEKIAKHVSCYIAIFKNI